MMPTTFRRSFVRVGRWAYRSVIRDAYDRVVWMDIRLCYYRPTGLTSWMKDALAAVRAQAERV